MIFKKIEKGEYDKKKKEKKRKTCIFAYISPLATKIEPKFQCLMSS